MSMYLILALATAIAAMYELFVPVMTKLSALSPEHNMVQYKYLTYFVFFASAFVLAPVFLIIVIVPTFSESFRSGMVSSIVE